MECKILSYILSVNVNKLFNNKNFKIKFQSNVWHFVIDSSGNDFLKISHNNSSILTHHVTKINFTQCHNDYIYRRNSITHYVIYKHFFRVRVRLCSCDDKACLRGVFMPSVKMFSSSLKPAVPRGSNLSHVEHQHMDYHNNMSKNQRPLVSKFKWKSEQGV